MSRNQTLSRVLVALLVAMCAVAARAEAPAVMAQVPASAPIVVIVRDLSQLSAKLAMLNQKLALNSGEMADALGMVKMLGGIEKGLNDKGSMALVVAEVPDPEAAGPPAMFALVPVSDYAGFVSNFGVAGADGAAVTRIEMQGSETFVKKAGDYAVISDRRQVVADYAGGGGAIIKNVGALGAEAVDRSDVIVYLDFATLGPALRDKVAEGFARMKQQIGALGEDSTEAEVGLAMISIYGNVVQSLLRDGQAMVIGADLAEEGVGLSVASQFKPGSPLAQAFAKAPAKPLNIGKLPKRPFMMAMAMDTDTLPIKQWASDFAGSLPPDHWMGAMIKSQAKTLDAMRGTMQMAYYGPQPGGAGPPSLFSAVSVVESDKPADYVAATVAGMTALNGVNLGNGMSMTTTYQKNVMQVAGHEIDQYTMKYNIPAELSAQLGPAGLLLGQAQTGYITTTANAVVMTNGSDPVLIKEAIEAAKADGAGAGLDADAGVVAMRKHLPQSRVAETYIGVGTVMQMVNGIVGMFAPDMVVPIPANLPPVAASASVSGGAVSVREFVPMPVIVAIKNAAMKIAEKQGLAGGPGVNVPARQPAVVAAPESRHLLTLTADNFKADVLDSDKVVLVYFWAEWSRPCKEQSPIISAIADKYAGKAAVGKIDIDVVAHQDLADEHQVEAIPTMLIVKGGKVVSRFRATTNEATLAEAIDAALR